LIAERRGVDANEVLILNTCFDSLVFFSRLTVEQVFGGNGMAPGYAIKLLDWSARLGIRLEEVLGHCREIGGGLEVHGSQS